MVNLTKITAGLMRFEEYNQAFIDFIDGCLERGITCFDTADIYVQGKNEAILGEYIKNFPEKAKKMQVITKTGIIFPGFKDQVFGSKTPGYDVTLGHLRHDYEYLTTQLNDSLRKLNLKTIDLYLIHRPSPLCDYQELARFLREAIVSGKVKEVGVSNFYPHQVEALQSYLGNIKIRVNQIEWNVFCLEHFKNGNMEYMQQNQMQPMAWSCLGGLYGILDQIETNETYKNIYTVVEKVSQELGCSPIQTMYAWINRHPLNCVLVSGTTKLTNLDEMIKALDITLNENQWFEIYVATQGYPMP